MPVVVIAGYTSLSKISYQVQDSNLTNPYGTLTQEMSYINLLGSTLKLNVGRNCKAVSGSSKTSYITGVVAKNGIVAPFSNSTVEASPSTVTVILGVDT